MAPATCNPGPGPRPDPSRKWMALGTEVSVSVAAFAWGGWWLSERYDSPLVLVALCLAGVVVAFWRLLRAAAKP